MLTVIVLHPLNRPYRLKLLKQVLQFLRLLNMAFSFLRIFCYNLLHAMRLVKSVRLPPFLSKTDPDFASYARKCPDGWLKWNASINLKRLWRQSTARTRLSHGLGVHGSMKSFVGSVWAQGSGLWGANRPGTGAWMLVTIGDFGGAKMMESVHLPTSRVKRIMNF